MGRKQLKLPAGTNSVRVRMVDTSCTLSIKASSFITPTVPGQSYLDVVDQCFLVEHERTGSKLMFDLGVRKDYWNLPPVVLQRLSLGVAVRSLNVPRDVPEMLAASDISLQEISTVIWSHYHWDHIGNMGLFPSATKLVVGPGFLANSKVMPGYPENLDSPIPSDALAGREVREVDFTETKLEIGGFRAHDFFGDGSFYLLDTPGHCLGHICGLARTTAGQESTFIFLGGDICHSAACFRPSTTYPLSAAAVNRYLCATGCTKTSHSKPPSSDYASKDERDVDRPLHQISTAPTSAYVKTDEAQDSVEKLMAFDSSPAVLVLIAHDSSLPKHLPSLNRNADLDLNGWKKENWKASCRWDWLTSARTDGNDSTRAVEFWRDGSVWSEAQNELAQKSVGVLGTGL